MTQLASGPQDTNRQAGGHFTQPSPTDPAHRSSVTPARLLPRQEELTSTGWVSWPFTLSNVPGAL